MMQILTAALAPLTGLTTKDADVELEANVIVFAVLAYDAEIAYDAVTWEPEA